MKTRARGMIVTSLLFIDLICPTADAGSLTMTCRYETVSSPTGVREEHMTFKFVVDTFTGKAVLVGNNGVADVEQITGFAAMTFVEPLPTGAVQTTTVASNGASVHSRHTLDPFGGVEFMPTQYYGTCTKIEN